MPNKTFSSHTLLRTRKSTAEKVASVTTSPYLILPIYKVLYFSKDDRTDNDYKSGIKAHDLQIL